MDPRVRAGIFAGESGGDYDALFGFSNRPGGRFAGTKLTDMTVDQAIEFSNPRGPYAQHVKGQIGRVATPMGGYQIVGTTLREAKRAMGLSGSERMTPETQDRLGDFILKRQGTRAWEGYRGPREPGSVKPVGRAPQSISGVGSPTEYQAPDPTMNFLQAIMNARYGGQLASQPQDMSFGQMLLAGQNPVRAMVYRQLGKMFA